MAWTVLGLCPALWLFALEVDQGPFSPMFGLLFGVPFVIGHGLLVLLPACLYAAARPDLGTAARRRLVGTAAFTITLSIAGVVLAFVLPRTHGLGW